MKNQILVIIIFYLVGVFSLSAQSIAYNNGQDNFLRLEFNKPVYSNTFSSPKFFTFDSFLNGEFRIGKKDKIAFEIPFSRFAFEGFGFGTFSDTNLGNIALAYQIRNLENSDYFEFKLRLPTGGDGGLLLTDYTERITAGFPDLFSIEVSKNLESKNSLGWYYRFRPGATLLIPSNDDAFFDTEFLLGVNLLGGYRNEKFEVNAGITTLTILTGESNDFGDRILSQFLTSFTYKIGDWKPGLIFRIPLENNFQEALDLVIGVHVGYTFGRKSNDDSAKE